MVPWDRLVRDVVPFLVTRQIFAGAGKLGIEAESAAGQPGIYQISQRADFFSALVSIDTMVSFHADVLRIQRSEVDTCAHLQ